MTDVQGNECSVKNVCAWSVHLSYRFSFAFIIGHNMLKLSLFDIERFKLNCSDYMPMSLYSAMLVIFNLRINVKGFDNLWFYL